MRGSMIISIVSVALVLVILGIVILTSIVAKNSTSALKSDVEAVVKIDDMASPEAVDSLSAAIKTAPYLAALQYRSAAEVLAEWSALMADDELPETNPFLPEYHVKVKPQWANTDSLNAIKLRLEKFTAVWDEVVINIEQVHNANLFIHSLITALLIIAATMLAISFVLINNTVRMEIYAHRFTIHTMQYVGATRNFIRRPYIMRSAMSGLIAAVIATIFLIILYISLSSEYPPLRQHVSYTEFGLVGLVLAAVGMILCALGAWLAASKYLRKNHDEIFN